MSRVGCRPSACSPRAWRPGWPCPRTLLRATPRAPLIRAEAWGLSSPRSHHLPLLLGPEDLCASHPENLLIWGTCLSPCPWPIPHRSLYAFRTSRRTSQNATNRLWSPAPELNTESCRPRAGAWCRPRSGVGWEVPQNHEDPGAPRESARRPRPCVQLCPQDSPFGASAGSGPQPKTSRGACHRAVSSLAP